MTQLKPNTALIQYINILTHPNRTAWLSHDGCLDWSVEQKAQNLKSMTDCLGKKGLSVHLTDKYYSDETDAYRKGWEVFRDENGRKYRPVPVGELDMANNIYLNIKDIGYVSAFFTLMHLYGHRVQGETMTKLPDTLQARHYAHVTKYVSWPKPLNMADVYEDYRNNPGMVDADYEEDFLEFEKEAFAYGFGLMQDAGIPLTDKLLYAVNTYIIADFEEIKTWWENSPNKNGDDFNRRYKNLYDMYKEDGDYIARNYQAISPKSSPFVTFKEAENRVVVVRNNILS